MSAAASGARSRARQVALQVLYAIDIAGRDATAPPGPARAFEEVAEHFEMPPAARDFAAALVVGCCAQRESLDALLARHSRNWRVDRMAAVDRNILRLAAFELLRGESPPPVVIDEAIELARRFGAEGSAAFVNGVADAMARAVASGGEPAAGTGAG